MGFTDEVPQTTTMVQSSSVKDPLSRRLPLLSFVAFRRKFDDRLVLRQPRCLGKVLDLAPNMLRESREIWVGNNWIRDCASVRPGYLRGVMRQDNLNNGSLAVLELNCVAQRIRSRRDFHACCC
jgi:hypothetical protein